MQLTRRQQEIFNHLRENAGRYTQPPTLDELCTALGLKSRGSLHKHIQVLIQQGLVEPMAGKQRGVRLAQTSSSLESELPLLGYIAAGQPIEAITGHETMQVPDSLRTSHPCYVLQVKGESMIEEGILDGDWVVIEQRSQARDGQIIVALIEGQEATLKRIEQRPGRITLHPANSSMSPQHYKPSQVQIQGVLVGQMRRY